jgi:CheY-like chemotaxis protein
VGLRILLVEPDEAERRQHLTLLARCLPSGSTVEAVGTAEDALVLIKSAEFDAVIAEHRLPKLSGLDLFHFLRRYAPDTLRVLTTYYNQVSFLRRAQSAAEPHLTLVKTGEPEKWCEELERLLAERGLLTLTGDASGPAAARAERH